MPSTVLVNLPSATSTLTAVGSVSSPMFDNLLSIGVFSVGFLIGGAIVYTVIVAIISGITYITGRRDGGAGSHKYPF